MFKFLIILGLVCYVLFKIAGFFFKIVFSAAQQRAQHTSQHRNSDRQPNRSGDKLNIDYIPKDQKKTQDFKGGDYVDYEEIK